MQSSRRQTWSVRYQYSTHTKGSTLFGSIACCGDCLSRTLAADEIGQMSPSSSASLFDRRCHLASASRHVLIPCTTLLPSCLISFTFHNPVRRRCSDQLCLCKQDSQNHSGSVQAVKVSCLQGFSVLKGPKRSCSAFDISRN